MDRNYKFGIVGCGMIASHHADSIMEIENTEITAVCDIIEEKAAEFAKEYNVKKY